MSLSGLRASKPLLAQVEAKATENISIDINPAANVQAGTYKIPVRATTSSTSADIELEVVVTGSYDIELTTPRGLLSAEITAGDMKRIDLLVRNNGSAELKDVQLTASKPVDWEVTFEPSKIEKLTAGGTTNVTATIKASGKALPGDYVTKMTAKTPEVNTTAEFRHIRSYSYGLRLVGDFDYYARVGRCVLSVP